MVVTAAGELLLLSDNSTTVLLGSTTEAPTGSTYDPAVDALTFTVKFWELLAATNPDRRHDAEQVRAVLLRVGLGHLSQRLDETANWDQILSEGERQRLAFARLHLAAPEIVLIDDAMHALDEADAAALFADLRASLPTAMLVTAGGSAVLETSASQTLDTGKAPARRPARGSAYRGAKSGTH